MENKISLLILADDLTGALDTGVQFVKKDIDIEVFLSLDDAMAQGKRETGANTAMEVRVINTNTRHASAEEARRIVTAAVNAFRDANLPRDCAYFYKKTDSCLRGNIGAELEALMEATGTTRLPFVPAYPALKRTTLGGCQYLDGKPLHQSPMASDPLNPVTDSFIPAIIGKQSKIAVRLVPLGVAMGTDLQETGHILVFDGETSAQLKAIARTLLEKGLLRASAGCAGFAEALMEALPFGGGDERLNAFAPGAKLPILIVSGSLNPVSVGQVEAAREKDVPCFGVAEEELLAEAWLESESARSLADYCRRLLEARGICVLGTDLAIGKARLLTSGDPRQIASGIIADGLGKITQSIIDEAGPFHLVVFGGDTLLGIMKALRYRRLKPLKEIYPGVVLASTDGSKGFIVTKSGAFGDRALIMEIERWLENMICY